MIKINIQGLRDPYVLIEDNVYYMYGTGVNGSDWDNSIWACYKNIDGKLDGEWKRTEKLIYECPENAEKNFYAPEIHKYKGHYYMFASYYSSVTKHRGCTILKADSPEGPFVEITDGQLTPGNWDAIDGTLWVDENDQPWMIFCREFTCTDDGIGRVAAAKLSENLTHFISDPIELFRGDDPSWKLTGRVTDGCFMYKASDNQLLMIWSSYCKDGYCVGIARNRTGGIEGKWEHDDTVLFSMKTTGEYDGGHGMIFTDKDGQMYLSVHSPNGVREESRERPLFIPIHEENGTLVCV